MSRKLEHNQLRAFRDKTPEQIIYTNGCFDLLHAGHIYWLDLCRQQTEGILVVGVTPDDIVSRNKGPERPIIDEQSRLSMVTALEVVDYGLITPSTSSTYPFLGMQVLSELRPEIFVTYDNNWQNDSDWLSSIGVELCLIEPENPPNISTSQIIERITYRY